MTMALAQETDIRASRYRNLLCNNSGGRNPSTSSSCFLVNYAPTFSSTSRRKRRNVFVVVSLAFIYISFVYNTEQAFEIGRFLQDDIQSQLPSSENAVDDKTTDPAQVIPKDEIRPVSEKVDTINEIPKPEPRFQDTGKTTEVNPNYDRDKLEPKPQVIRNDEKEPVPEKLDINDTIPKPEPRVVQDPAKKAFDDLKRVKEEYQITASENNKQTPNGTQSKTENLKRSSPNLIEPRSLPVPEPRGLPDPEPRGQDNLQYHTTSNNGGNAIPKDERAQKKGCSHTPYVLIGDILATMPPTVAQSARQVPSYIQLCKAFIERSEATGFSRNGNYIQSRVGGDNDNSGQSVNAITEEMYNNGITVENPNQEPVGAITEDMHNQGITDDKPVGAIAEEVASQGITVENPDQKDSGAGTITEEMRLLDEANTNNGDAESDGTNGIFRIVEDTALCEDWVAPHYSTLQIFASSLIAALGRPLGLRYKHDCRQHVLKMHNDPTKHYDYTSVQSLLPDNLISRNDVGKIGSNQMKQMCQKCISDYESLGLPEFMSGKTHQCLMMPDDEMAESLLSDGRELPMTLALPSIIDRLRQIADDWNTCNPLKNEETSGAIIALDGKSTMMNYSVYDTIIPSGVTSIQIFASSSCGLDYVERKTDCIEHGRRLKRYFIQTRPRTYVRYDVVGSSAASSTRMINARILVCPPGTIMCLLPALAKKAGTKAYIAEDPSEVETFKWFEYHVLAERKALGFQDKGFDAFVETDYLDIISDVSLDMPLDVIGEREGDASNAPNHGLDNDNPADNEQMYEDYSNWIAKERADTGNTDW